MVYAASRAGEHARAFLGDWRGSLVTDDYPGYKKTFSQDGVIEIGCMARMRDVNSSISTSRTKARSQCRPWTTWASSTPLNARPARWRLRQQRAKPIADALHAWMLAQRSRVLDGSGTAKALGYSLKRWVALTRYLDDGAVPIDNNHIEQRIRPVALGRKNWLFAGSLRAGKRAAAIMRLIQSVKLNGHDPQVYLQDVLTRLPTHKASAIDELLPHNWQPAAS